MGNPLLDIQVKASKELLKKYGSPISTLYFFSLC
jgi:hypothetical protein